ncbi:MAG: sugar transferase, partial [Pseudomonadota bacterium]
PAASRRKSSLIHWSIWGSGCRRWWPTGDMSLIGPRPQTQRCFDAFPARSQSVITQVPPGLSGIGSIVFRDEARLLHDAKEADALYDHLIMPYKGLLEEWYVAHRNVRTYFLLLFLTVWAVLRSNTQLHFRCLPSLPQPPAALAPLLKA